MIALFGLGPVFYVLSLVFVGSTSPYQKSVAIAEEVRQVCATAGEVFTSVPDQMPGVFVDFRGTARYGDIRDGVYSNSGSSIFGESLIGTGSIRFIEWRAEKVRKGKAWVEPQNSYERIAAGTIRTQVDSLEATHGVYRTELNVSGATALGTSGVEVAVKSIPDGIVLSTYRYFKNSKTRQICGPIADGSIDEARFIRRALGAQR